MFVSTHNGRFWVVLKILNKMTSLWFVLDFNGSLGISIVDLG